MLSNIPPEITIASFSVVGILTGYVWNDQSCRIKKIEEDILKCPMTSLKVDVAEMKTDIKWIKDQLKSNL